MPYVRTPEIRKKISESIKLAHKRRPGPWRRDYTWTEESKKLMSQAKMGKPLTDEHIKNRTIAQRGLKRSLETRKRLSLAKKGERSPLWRGGISKKNRLIRSSLEYKLWRAAVFERDDWTCQECGERGGELHAHHIKSFKEFIDLRFAIDNGVTLCIDCHKKTDSYLNNKI